MKDYTKRPRFIVRCQRGFVNAEWVNGRTFPECWGYSVHEATSYTESRASVLVDILEERGNHAYMIQII